MEMETETERTKEIKRLKAEALEAAEKAEETRRAASRFVDKTNELASNAAAPFIAQANAASMEIVAARRAEAERLLNIAAEARAAEAAAEAALGIAQARYPEGTILHEWKDISGPWSSVRTFKATGRTGVTEIARTGMAWPENQSWSKPAPGMELVRPILKDGRKAITADRIGAYNRRGALWLPEGEKPKGAE